MQVLLDFPAPHQHLALVPTVPHQAVGLALVGKRGVGGHAVAAEEPRRGVEPAVLLEGIDGRAGVLDGDGARLPGQSGCEQVRAGEHRLALRQVRRRPRHRLQ